jgi:hypothetical protein
MNYVLSASGLSTIPIFFTLETKGIFLCVYVVVMGGVFLRKIGDKLEKKKQNLFMATTEPS